MKMETKEILKRRQKQNQRWELDYQHKKLGYEFYFSFIIYKCRKVLFHSYLLNAF